MDLKKLLAKVFNHFAYKNILKDFDIMSKHSRLKQEEEVKQLCLLWFALGHLNSMDRDSNFIKNFNGENTDGNGHGKDQ
jgi:hypothetical protein